MKFFKQCISVLILVNITVFAKEEPKYVNLHILGALIGPTKVNKKPWDASFKFNKSVGSLFADMVIPGSSFAVSTIIDVIGKDAPKGSAAPDIYGYVHPTGPTISSLSKYGGTPIALATRNSVKKNTYIPNFNVSYMGWPLFKDTRFRIQLWDKDLSEDDNIAIVELNYDDILKAIEHKKPLWINVSEQSMNQLGFIQISATNALENSTPNIVGYRF